MQSRSLPPFNPQRPMLVSETMTKAGAIALAKKIEQLWRSYGYYGLRVEVVQDVINPENISMEIYSIRSNMTNGVPPC